MNRTVLLVATFLILGFSMITLAGPNLITQTYAQNENKTSEGGMKNMTNATASLGKIPSMSTPGQKTFYLFTSEVENVNETKLKVAGVHSPYLLLL